MGFRFFALTGALILAAASFWLMPQIRAQVKNNPQVLSFIQQPDRAFAVISQCQKQVDDVKRCYNAWTAGVALAESGDCSAVGLEHKRRFKPLVEHISGDDLDKAIVKDCPPPQ